MTIIRIEKEKTPDGGRIKVYWSGQDSDRAIRRVIERALYAISDEVYYLEVNNTTLGISTSVYEDADLEGHYKYTDWYLQNSLAEREAFVAQIHNKIDAFNVRCTCGNTDFAQCGRCVTCCSAYSASYLCPHCTEHRHLARCPRCNNCYNCCICEHCDIYLCLELPHTNDGDGVCGRCATHCSCIDWDDEDTDIDGDEIEPDYPRQPTTVHKADNPKVRKHFKSKRTIGVEWEYNSAPTLRYIMRWINKWGGARHRDGSCGWEIVTPPLAGDHIFDCITELGKAFDDSSASADEDCGIHVHVDARDINWPDMYRFLHAYSIIEPILYIIGGQHRQENSYCAPCGNKYRRALVGGVGSDRRGKIAAAAFNTEDGRLALRGKPEKKNHGRYKGLNLCPWLTARREPKAPRKQRIEARVTNRDVNTDGRRKDCTVEFRLHANSLDAEQVAHWAQLCASIVDWAASATDAEAQALPKSGLRALIKIAPHMREFIMKKVLQWRKETYRVNPLKSGAKQLRKVSFNNGVYTLDRPFEGNR